MATRTKGRGRTPEAQEGLPGIAQEVLKILPLTRAAKRLKRAKQATVEANLEAKNAKARLLAIVDEHRKLLTKDIEPGDPIVFKVPGLTVTIKTTTNIDLEESEGAGGDEGEGDDDIELTED